MKAKDSAELVWKNIVLKLNFTGENFEQIQKVYQNILDVIEKDEKKEGATTD